LLKANLRILVIDQNSVYNLINAKSTVKIKSNFKTFSPGLKTDAAYW